MATKIEAVHVENFKRIKEVDFHPFGDGLTIIGGNNKQGKTSAVDAIAWALGGAKREPSNPINSEATGDMDIHIELSNGLVVERKGKNGSLKVTDSTGKKHGQEILNGLISQLALNIPAFMDANDKQKAIILLDTLGIKGQLNELQSKEDLLYNERTSVGRIADSLKKHANEMPYYWDAPKSEVSASSIIDKQNEAIKLNASNASEREKLNVLQARLERFNSDISDFDNQTAKMIAELEQRFLKENESISERINERKNYICELEQKLNETKESYEALIVQLNGLANKKADELIEIQHSREAQRQSGISKIDSLKQEIETQNDVVSKLSDDIDLNAFKQDFEELEQQNAKYRANIAHDKAKAESDAKQLEYDSLTEQIEEIRRNRLAILNGVTMPLPDLTIKDTVLYYKGQKWDCMSGAEKLIVATSIVKNINPNCGFVLMDKLEQMDLDSLSEFENWLVQNNLQVIATRVSKGSECSIIIDDGLVLQN